MDDAIKPEQPEAVALPAALVDGCSIASLAAALVGLCVPFAGVLAFVLGAVGFVRAKRRVRRGRWLAVTGLVLGAASVVLHAVYPTPGHVPEQSNRVRCASNLRLIGLLIRQYVDEHNGAFPPNLVSLHLEHEPEGLAEYFICPSSNATPWQQLPASDDDAMRLGHLSYLYFGAGLTGPVPDDRPIAMDVPTNHDGDGYNVLFAGGFVEWVDPKGARVLLERLAAEGAISPADIPKLMPQRR
jgi:hypothetical protein